MDENELMENYSELLKKGDVLIGENKIVEALEYYEIAYLIIDSICLCNTNTRDISMDFIKCLEKIIDLYFSLGNFNHARKFFQESLNILENICSKDSAAFEFKICYVQILEKIGDVQKKLGKSSDSYQLYNKAINITEELLNNSLNIEKIKTLNSKRDELRAKVHKIKTTSWFNKSLNNELDIKYYDDESAFIHYKAITELGYYGLKADYNSFFSDINPHLYKSFPTKRGECESTILKTNPDDVDCTIFAPSEVNVESEFMIQVYAYISGKEEEAINEAKEFDPKTKRGGKTSLGTKMERGSKLAFKLEINKCEIDESYQELIWNGKTDHITFIVTVPRDDTIGSIIGKLFVYQEKIPIGKIKFSVDVVKKSAFFNDIKPAGEAIRYDLAFISYSRNDRQKVLERIQMLSKVGVRYYHDLLDLESGDHWKKKLFEFIDESNVMLLFWSTNAKNSEWVKNEWEYALKNKENDYIHPVPIEGPPIPEPPKELEHLHFDDIILHIK